MNNMLCSCPICGADSSQYRTLPSRHIRDALAAYYAVPLDTVPDVIDYLMARCGVCSFEFCTPATPGDDVFYDWITRKPNYYPEARWEWKPAYDRISASGEPCSVLEVGCGEGHFLELFKASPNVTAVGLDLTERSVQACVRKGLTAYNRLLSDFLADGQAARFDFAVAFHCLEHVPTPLLFIREMLRALKPNGRLIMSTPHSPMSFEHRWFDPLNHPPHHLSRWNDKSYRAVAARLGLDVGFLQPQAEPFSKRLLTAMNLRRFGPRRREGYRRALRRSFLTPIASVRDVVAQLRHRRFEGRAAADVILAEFRTAAARGEAQGLENRS